MDCSGVMDCLSKWAILSTMIGICNDIASTSSRKDTTAIEIRGFDRMVVIFFSALAHRMRKPSLIRRVFFSSCMSIISNHLRNFRF